MLLRHYLKLGGKLLAFSLDGNFSNTLDGLILVDLAKTNGKMMKDTGDINSKQPPARDKVPG